MAFLDVALADLFGMDDNELVEAKKDLSLGRQLSGQAGAEAAQEGARLQYESAREAREQLERLNQPYLEFGEQFIPQATSILQNPMGYLENNPMFDAALNFSQRNLNQTNAATGRFSTGGAVQEAFNNYLSQGEQFINNALNRTLQPITLGQNAANFQGTNASNLITGGGNALAAGGIGAANAMGQGASNVAGIGTALLGAFLSDERTKEDMEILGKDDNGMNVYKFKYKEPEYIGYSAQEVAMSDPDHAMLGDDGYLRVSEKYKPVMLYGS